MTKKVMNGCLYYGCDWYKVHKCPEMKGLLNDYDTSAEKR